MQSWTTLTVSSRYSVSTNRPFSPFATTPAVRILAVRTFVDTRIVLGINMDDTMSTAETPSKYEPSQRLIDNPQRLRALYCSRGLTIEEIAEEHAEVGKSRVGQKLKEYRLTECGCCESAPQTHHVDENHDSRHCNNSSDSTRSGNRGSDPPSVDWTDAV